MESEDNHFPFEGLIGLDGRRQAITRAKRDYEQESIPKTGNYLVDSLNRGWHEHKTLKTKRKMRKNKSHNDYWEHKVWSLIASYDFDHLNDIHDKGKFSINGVHQIDVFSFGEGVSLVIECKSREKYGKESLRKRLFEIAGYQKRAEKKIKKGYGNSTQVAWVLATRNYQVSKADRKLALDNNISLLNEGQIDYFIELYKRTGLVSKYQLLSELFGDKPIPKLRENIPAIKTKIGEYDAYIFSINPGKILPISYISHMGNQSIDEINAFQRMVSKNRLKSIASFIQDSNGFFPNSLLINIDSRGEGAKFKSMTRSEGIEFGSLTLPGFYKTAWIIDGQHRLLAFAETPQKDTLLVPVIAFHDLEPHIQSNMFVDINNKQKKVTKNIIIELNATLKWGSPKPKEMLESLHARTMMYLNKRDDSPLKGLIKLTGESSTKNNPKPFTTNTVVTAISKLGLFGKIEKNAHTHGNFWVSNSDPEKSRVESVELVYEVIVNYLRVFSDKCDNWDVFLTKEEGAFVMTNQGISALLLVMGDLIQEYTSKNNVKPRDYSSEEIIGWIARWMSPMIEFINQCDVSKLITIRSRLGLQGQQEIKYILEGEINKMCPNFNPKGLETELGKLSDQWMTSADQLVDKMEKEISSNIIRLLKENYGEDLNDWFYGDGIPQNTQTKVASTKIKNRSSFEGSFDIIDWKAVVSSKENYQSIFKDIYSLKNYPKKGDSGKEKTLSWFDKLNTVRNTVKHKIGKRVSEEEYLDLKFIWDILKVKIDLSNESIN